MIDIGSIERLDAIYSGKCFIIASYDFSGVQDLLSHAPAEKYPGQPENQSDGNCSLTPASRNTSHHDARACLSNAN